MKYGITSATDSNTIIKKLVTYATLHYLQVHKWLGAENDLWTAGKYYQTGYDGANYLHSIFGAFQAIPNATDKETIQLLLNGLFEPNKLPDPTTIVPCLDDATAHSIVVFLGQFLEKAAKGSISDISALKQLVEDFGKSIPDAVKKCLDGNAEFTALGVAFGITPETSSSAIEKKVIAYVTLHYLDVHKRFGTINDSWKAGKSFETGKGLSDIAHKALGSSNSTPNLTDKEILQ